MVKVITYGTFDLLHYGHYRLLERAKALGDFLIVGVTSDDYDRERGKINSVQTLMERVNGVKATGLADEIIVEEYDGQKIEDIRKYGIDIFAVGSDWEGRFDYLNEYCRVQYLPRTEGVSSTELRSSQRVRVKIVGNSSTELTSIEKFLRESRYVNGIEIVNSDACDAVYVCSHPTEHYDDVKAALLEHKHVLCESPIALTGENYRELVQLANQEHCILMDGLKTAYATAFERLVLLVRSGKIGEILSVDATCTSMKNVYGYSQKERQENWNTITEWGPIALLPVFQILGTQYKSAEITTRLLEGSNSYDAFTKLDFLYDTAVASVKLAKGAKSEGELIITGTDGYIYVPAPWWKTEYFEIRYENPAHNRRFFYQLEGEGIRYEIVAFIRAIQDGTIGNPADTDISEAICVMMQQFYQRKNVRVLSGGRK